MAPEQRTGPPAVALDGVDGIDGGRVSEWQPQPSFLASALGPPLAAPPGPPAGPPPGGLGPVPYGPVPVGPVPPVERSGRRVRAAVEAALPESLRGARLDPGRRGVAVIAVIALLAAAIAGLAAWRARPAPEPLGVPTPDHGSISPSAGPVVVVAVAGKVRRPGLVRLPPGSRVADAVAAAGGVLPGVDLGLMNLARKLVDGELVVVGPAPPAGAAPGAAPPPQPGAPSAGAATGSLLDLNTATVAQLDALPGVGPVLAQRIVDYRTEHGGFRSVDQLREVDGIGDSRFEKLRELVTA